MSAFANLINLIKLDLEKCPEIHGGLVHLQGMFASKSTYLESELLFLLLRTC